MALEYQIIILQRKWRKWRLRPPTLFRSYNTFLLPKNIIDSPLNTWSKKEKNGCFSWGDTPLHPPLKSINWSNYREESLGFLDKNYLKQRYPSNNSLTIPIVKRSFSYPSI